MFPILTDFHLWALCPVCPPWICPRATNNPGSPPGLDLKKLKVWQLKGNFQSQPLEILVSKVTGIK